MFLFQINAVLSTFLFIKESWTLKLYYVFYTSLSNIDNNKICLLSNKSVISEGSLKTGVMMLKIKLCVTGINDILNIPKT